MCRESMMRRTASAICLARTVCCSNLVFTADWEMHSWNRQEVLRRPHGHQQGQALVSLPRTGPVTAGKPEAPETRIKDSPQTSSQNSETRASSLESLLQERPLGELHVSLEIAAGEESENPQSHACQCDTWLNTGGSRELLTQAVLTTSFSELFSLSSQHETKRLKH